MSEPIHYPLYDDTILDQKVRDEVPDQNILVANFDATLLGYLKAGLTKFYSRRVLADFFQKSGAEDVAHLMDATNDLLGNMIQP